MEGEKRHGVASIHTLNTKERKPVFCKQEPQYPIAFYTNEGNGQY